MNHSRHLLFAVTRRFLNWPPAAMPFSEKITVLKSFAQDRHPATFVESGTLHGDTLAAVRDEFIALFSIELEQTLYEKAVTRFKNDAKISITKGDSGQILQDIIVNIKGPIVFWLDGHYSGNGTARGSQDCPILYELDAIIARGSSRDIVLVDDARLFGSRFSYPALASLNEKLKPAFPEVRMQIHGDIACFILGAS